MVVTQTVLAAMQRSWPTSSRCVLSCQMRQASVLMLIRCHRQYIACEVFTSLPHDLRTLNHKLYTNDLAMQDRYADPLPPSTRDAITSTQSPDAIESLTSYTDPQNLTLNAVTAYISIVTAAPPAPSTTRPESNECEICGRDQLPLTYHHLIPKDSHAKVLKRGWHPEEDLNNVAWICRACHNLVHSIASNDELAREWYTVELLMGREDVQRFAKWIGRVRWKSR